MTSSPLTDRFRGVLGGLGDSLAAYHETLDIGEASEPRVSQALDWLVANRADEGYWGYRSTAVTALSAVAIAAWRPSEAGEVLAPTAEWLCTQADDGAWETPWDSAVALVAVYLSGFEGEPAARRASERMLAVDPSEDWRGRVHHAAQVLNAHAVLGASQDRRDSWSDALARLVSIDDGPYVCGQAIHALLVNGRRNPADFREEIEMLGSFLDRTPLSTSAFLDHAAALQALAATEEHSDVVGRTLDKMFAASFRRDGSWYHEPWYTAWALLALREAEGVRRIIVEAPAFNRTIRQAEEAVDAIETAEKDAHQTEVRQRRITALLGFAVAADLGALVTVGVLWSDTDSLLVSGVLVSMLLSALAACGAALRRRLM